MTVTEPVNHDPDEHFHNDYAQLRASRARTEAVANFVSRALGYVGFVLAIAGLLLFIFK